MKKNRLYYLLIVSITMLCIACKQKKQVVPKDVTITSKTAYLSLFMNDADILHFIADKKLNEDDSTLLISYYNNRNLQYAWFDSSGITEHALSFINLCSDYASSINDSGIIDSLLLSNVQLLSDSAKLFSAKPEQLKQTEFGLTTQFFRYVKKAQNGSNDINPTELDWFIPRRKIDAKASLDSLLKTSSKDSLALLKVSPQFQQLLGYLKQYREIASRGGWDSVPAPAKSYKIDDSSIGVLALKKRLFAEGDLKQEVSNGKFDSLTKQALIAFQKRMGLSEDGAAGKEVVNQLNTPVQQRIETILINLERMRWMPARSNGRNILVNIPAFRLYVSDGSKPVFNMKVVAGKPTNSTVIFAGQMKYVVMSPYWNVPYSIVKNEYGNQSAAFFAKRNMEIVGRYSDGLPEVREKPGPSNSLGRVKFLFPNSYSIYLHDTPAKDRFNENSRAFSHGCIRLSEPVKLAYYLLEGYPDWPKEKIDKTMDAGKETYATLKQNIPVTIGYFTAWVDAEGKINFRKDIYGHDGKMAKRLFK